MKITDLRIGNLVTDEWYDSFPKIIEIDSIHKTGVNIVATDDNKPYGMASPIIEAEYPFDQLRPIPLTEEWLIKFGFSESYRSNNRVRFDLPNCKFGYDFHEFGEESGEYGFRYIGSYFHHVKYINQLQNIFHALTGQELTIKS